MRTRKVLSYYVMFSLAIWTAFKVAYLWEKWLHWQEDLLLDAYKNDDYNGNRDIEDEFIKPDFTGACHKEVKRIALVKTHKTGGSTITSILNRFADLNNLEVALPVGLYRFNWPYTFRFKYVDRTRLRKRTASVICNHLVFHDKEISKVMERPYKLVTILRNPIEQFASYFYFEKFQKIFNITDSKDPIARFFSESHFYMSRNRIPLHGDLLLRDGMSFDLNFGDFQLRPFNNSIANFINYMEEKFHLVMITEYFDESLILLKRLMCWKYIDIAYHKKLVNRLRPRNLSSEAISQIKSWNALDMQLYGHFRKKLMHEILKLNKTVFYKELQIFRKINYIVNQFCKNRSKTNFETLVNILSQTEDVKKDHEIYKRPYCYCSKFLRSEIDYINYFRRKYPKYHFNSKFRFTRKRSFMC